MADFAAGQVMLVYAPASQTITGGASADWVYGTPDSGLSYRFAAKVLHASDLTGLAFSSNGNMTAWAVYAGPIAFAQRVQGQGSSGLQTLAGFTKGGWSSRLVVGLRANTTWTAPSGWAPRQAASDGGVVLIADIASGSYTNGSALTFGGSTGAFGATVEELLNY